MNCLYIQIKLIQIKNILFILFLFLIVSLSKFDIVFGLDKTLDIAISTTPKIVKINNPFTTNIIIKNIGSVSEFIKSIDLLYPSWDSSPKSFTPFSVGPNQTLFTKININVPENTTEGIYDVIIDIHTNSSQYIEKGNITISRITEFSLTGQIPISIIGIIIPGISSYIIIEFFRLKNNFSIDLSKMLLIAIPFGIISWYLLGIPIDEVGESGIQYFFMAEGLAIVLAFIYYIAAALIKKIFYSYSNYVDKLPQWSYLKKLEKLHIAKGPKIWLQFLGNAISIRDNIGQRYTFKLKIVYQNASNIYEEIEGLLWKYDEDPPNNIVLRPQFIAECHNKRKLIDVFLEMDKFKANYEKDKNYRNKVLEIIRKDYFYFQLLNSKYDNEVKEILRNTLISADNQKLSMILRKLDFSLFVKDLIEELDLPLQKDYGNFIYITANSIKSIEIASIETFYAIRLESLDKSELYHYITIPHTIPQSEFPF